MKMYICQVLGFIRVFEGVLDSNQRTFKENF